VSTVLCYGQVRFAQPYRDARDAPRCASKTDTRQPLIIP